MHAHHEPSIPPWRNPAAASQWEMLDAQFEGAATHVALLPTNKIFAYGGSSLEQSLLDSPPPAELLDLATWRTSKVAMHNVKVDIWCGGHTFLADGRLLFVGGTDYYPRGISPFYGGHRQAYTFDPFAQDESESWQRLPAMLCGRWYPTLIRLPDDVWSETLIQTRLEKKTASDICAYVFASPYFFGS
jgi:hypothetical protein